MIDIRGNLALGIAVALAGAAVVRSMKPSASTAARRRWIPATAFISGPLITVGWQLIEIYCISEFTHPDDVTPMIITALAIGLAAGTIGAITFWAFER
jgi:hypothetical protein